MSLNRLKGKQVLITGATSGIGRACARHFARAGCKLVLTGRREQRLAELKEELAADFNIEGLTFSFDVRDRSACKDVVKNLPGPVDILINNAGLAVGKEPIDEGVFEDWDRMIDTNIKGLLTMTRLIAPSMRERNKGHIINIGSVAGHEAYPGGAVYCATKHGVDAITKATKKDLHGTNIRVSAVSPGLVETEFSTVRFKGDTDSANNVYEGIEPLTATDIAEIVVFVANRPDHVNILDTLVFPVQQSSSTMVSRH